MVAKSIDDALLPITISNWIMGTGISEYPLGRPRPVFSAIYSTACLILFTTSILIYKKRYEEYFGEKINPNSKLFINTFSYGNILFSLTAIIMEKANREKLKHSMQEINTTDEQMRKMGILEDYGKVFRKEIYSIAILSTSIVLFEGVILLTAKSELNFEIKILRAISFYFAFGRPYLIELRFINIISYIRRKYSQLNDLLYKLTGCDSYSSQYAKLIYYKIGLMKATDFKLGQRTNDDRKLIRTAKQVHLDLVRISKDINDIFSFEILISLMLSIAILIIDSYDVFCIIFLPTSKMINKTIIFVHVFLFTFYVIKIIAINHVCYMTSEEVLMTGSVIYELHEPTTDPEFRAEIEEFIMQSVHNPLVFTAHGFFNLNHSFILGVVGLITTYLVTLVQLHTDGRE